MSSLEHHSSREQWRRRTLLGQGAYYVLTGLWPLIHMGSFEAVTGPKTDDWLVKMVGCLALAIGASLGFASRRSRAYAEDVVLLAAGSAGAFTLIDVWYVAAGRISPIYMADAVVEIALLVSLGLSRRPRAS
jgi:energy-converting hydrogenase Eha subunit E